MSKLVVEHVAHSGDDILVVDAARTSFGKQSKWEIKEDFDSIEDAQAFADTHNGRVDWNYISSDSWFGGYPVEYLSDKDKKLLDYLAREKHILPFRHPQITLRCKAPIFLARQLGKHQVGMSWSEESRRYITTEPEFFWPDKWRKKADNVKQGSSDEAVGDDDWAYGLPSAISRHMSDAIYLYNDMLDSEVAPELARMILPQNMMTTWVWTGSLLSFYQMYKLRAEAHAQKEARDFAELVKSTVQPLYPEAWAALERHV